ncbi:hypothetical protein C6A85_07925, partial [Mycobacterium sp. ITM-2017-0098]
QDRLDRAHCADRVPERSLRRVHRRHVGPQRVVDRHRLGDVAESVAINNALGTHMPAVYAPKAALGHSVGAVGAVESILT